MNPLFAESNTGTFAAFAENLILSAHPSKTGGDWWYGTVVRDGKKGFFPKTYIEQVAVGEIS